jgi:hypothetical protein
MKKKMMIVTIETFDEVTCAQIKKIIEFGLPFYTKKDAMSDVRKVSVKVEVYNQPEEILSYRQRKQSLFRSLFTNLNKG